MNEQQLEIAKTLSLVELTAAKTTALAACKLIAKCLFDPENPPTERTAVFMSCIRMILGESEFEVDQLADIHSDLETLWKEVAAREVNVRGMNLPNFLQAHIQS